MKGFGIYVKNDLLEAKHYKAMGQSIWLYLWLLDKVTSISENGIGKVLGGAPIKLSAIANDLPMSDRAYSRYIARLQKNGYITALRTPYGYVFTVHKAKKIFGRTMERTVKVAPRTVKVAGENRKSGGNKEDNTVDKTKDTVAEHSSARNTKDMFNKYSDDHLEGDIDLDGDGSIENPEETTKEKNAQRRKAKNEMIEWLIEWQGRDPKRLNRPSQLKALNELINMNVSPTEIKQIIKEAEVDDYFRSNNLLPDFHTVVKRVQKRRG